MAKEKIDTDKKEQKEEEEIKEPIEEKEIYEREIDYYRAAIKRNKQQAMKRYGFTLYHSLSKEEKIDFLKDHKFKLDQPEDTYNEAVLAFREEDYNKAKKLFEQVIKAKEDLTYPLYNLALTYEQLGNVDKAIKTWEKYLEHPKVDDDEKAEVENHLKELKK
jgi:tetratricopeptide (TPR) repeat protein